MKKFNARTGIYRSKQLLVPLAHIYKTSLLTRDTAQFREETEKSGEVRNDET